MPDIDSIILIIITSGQIFLQFAIITSLLKIKTNLWLTLLYSVLIASLVFDNRWAMLAIFYGSAIAYYVTATWKEDDRAKLSILSTSMHFFLSMYINNIVLITFAILLPYAELNLIRATALLVYIVLLYFVKNRKVVAVNLLLEKAIFILSSSMLVVGVAIQLILPISTDEFRGAAQTLSPLTGTIAAFMVVVLMSVIINISFFLSKLAVQVEKLEFENLYINTLEASLENLQTFKHTSRNMVNSLLGCCALKDYSTVEEYLRELAYDMRHDINIDTINVVIKEKMSYLYGIVLAKSALAATSNIRFEVDINATSFELKTLSKVQISRIVGNLLDNAFEAAAKSTGKEVTLRITNVMDNRIKVMVRNSIDEPIDTSRITEKGYSTKEGHTGFGLSEIETILKRQHSKGFSLKLEYRCTKDKFIAELLV